MCRLLTTSGEILREEFLQFSSAVLFSMGYQKYYCDVLCYVVAAKPLVENSSDKGRILRGPRMAKMFHPTRDPEKKNRLKVTAS